MIVTFQTWPSTARFLQVSFALWAADAHRRGCRFEHRRDNRAGTKGFGGGFGIRALEPWGEQTIKQFVQEALDEALKLGLALSRLRTARRIALLHYAPIVETVDGEPPEIYCFLGCSRLEEPLNRYDVTAVFHGHAHRGKRQGQTRSGIPVYNVSLPLLLQGAHDNGQPVLPVIEFPIETVEPSAAPIGSNRG